MHSVTAEIQSMRYNKFTWWNDLGKKWNAIFSGWRGGWSVKISIPKAEILIWGREVRMELSFEYYTIYSTADI